MVCSLCWIAYSASDDDAQRNYARQKALYINIPSIREVSRFESPPPTQAQDLET